MRIHLISYTCSSVRYAHTHVWLHFLLNACLPFKETSILCYSAYFVSLAVKD